MKKFLVKVVVVFLFASVFVCGESESKRYAVITQADGVVVRANIEPGANMITKALRGQRFEILGEGKLWLEVRTQSGNGFIPISSCDIKNSLDSNPAGAIILLLVLLGAVGGGLYLFYTKKTTVATSGGNVAA
jgi:hypothetical protein